MDFFVCPVNIFQKRRKLYCFLGNICKIIIKYSKVGVFELKAGLKIDVLKDSDVVLKKNFEWFKLFKIQKIQMVIEPKTQISQSKDHMVSRLFF